MLTKITEDPAAFSAAAAELERASARGDGYVTCMLATVEAVDAGRPQNRNRAFDLLLKSAELGHDHAQRQLQLLAQTHFPDIGLAYRGQTGDAIFFANVDVAGALDPQTRHGGLAPTLGEKWLLSQWIRDRTPVRA